MADGFEITYENYVYRIVWVCDGDLGGGIGEVPHSAANLRAVTDPNERECIVAAIAAKESDGAALDDAGYFWEEERQAKKALTMIKLALKADQGVPWPAWALKAKAERWTPPKGWKPS